MSEAVLQRSKLLCYFELEESISTVKDELLRPLCLPLVVYHFHYPTVYYPLLYQHFKNSLPSQCTQHHICLKKNGFELSSELPLGLELQANDRIIVGMRESPVPEGFRLTMTSWKKGYTIVNRQNGCDHIFRRLDEPQQRQLYQLHINGHSHNLDKVPRYEGNCIALKIYCERNIIQRKEDNLEMTIGQYFSKYFKGSVRTDKGVYTHGVAVNLGMKLQELLKKWNYNDGYCYLKVEGQ